MYNPETMTTFGTQEEAKQTNKNKNHTQHSTENQTDEQHGCHHKPGVNQVHAKAKKSLPLKKPTPFYS